MRLYKEERQTTAQIASKLNAEGIPGPSKKGRWGPQTVRRFILGPQERWEPPKHEATQLPAVVKVARHRL